MPRIDSNGLTLEVEVVGEGPPLLLIMGIGAPLVLWPDGLVAQLAAAGFRVIRFDHRDVGRSTWLDGTAVPSILGSGARAALGLPVPAPYSLWDMADDTVGLLDALGIDRAHVLGVSMGGMIGQCLAIRHPRRLRSLCSLMSTTGDKWVVRPRPSAVRALLGRPPRTRDEVVSFFVGLNRALAGDGATVAPDVTRQTAERIYDRGHNPEALARHWAAILATGDRTAALRGVQTPTLVLHGAADPLIPVAAGRATAEAIPGARWAVIEGLGHSLPEAAWADIVAAVGAHGRRHGGGER